MGYDNEYSRWCVLDIETVASPSVDTLLDPVRAPAHYKDPFKIQTYQLDKLAERIGTASLEPDLCEVVAIGVDDGELQAVTRAEMLEVDMLEWFWKRVWNCRLVGFNIMGFDLPVLIRRSQLLNVPRPAVNLDRYRSPHLDLLQHLSFNGVITYRSLKFYKRRFCLDCPDDDPVNGSDIPGLVAEQNWAAIYRHLVSDVTITKALAVRLGLLTDPAIVA